MDNYREIQIPLFGHCPGMCLLSYLSKLFNPITLLPLYLSFCLKSFINRHDPTLVYYLFPCIFQIQRGKLLKECAKSYLKADGHVLDKWEKPIYTNIKFNKCPSPKIFQYFNISVGGYSMIFFYQLFVYVYVIKC